jgi:hypothetical protein
MLHRSNRFTLLSLSLSDSLTRNRLSSSCRPISSTTLAICQLTTSGISHAPTSSTRSTPSTTCSCSSFPTRPSTRQWAITKQVVDPRDAMPQRASERMLIAPCNLFPTPSVRSDNITWLYETLADSWIKLGLGEETRESIRRGAFYTTKVCPGLRVISLNMNYCTSDNYWLLINATDPLGQLQWVGSMRILNSIHSALVDGGLAAVCGR